MLTFVIVALVGLASLQPSLSQEVDSRAGAGVESSIVGGSGGQSRTIHSQKHLSPHRMMHFGKRPMVAQAPGGDFDDLYLPQVVVQPQTQAQQQLQIVDPVLDGSQYSVFFNSPNERATGIVADLTPEAREILRNKQFADLVHSLLLESKEQCKAEERQSQELKSKQREAANLAFSRAPGSFRLMKMVQEQSSEAANAEASAAADSDGKQQGGEQSPGQQQDDQARPESISVVSRSYPKSSFAMMGNREPFDKVHIASLLLGRRLTEPPSSIASLGTYIKKAEPHKMTFMHFG